MLLKQEGRTYFISYNKHKVSNKHKHMTGNLRFVTTLNIP